VAALGVFSIILGTLGLLTLPFAIQPNWADYSGIRGGVVADHSPLATWGVVSTTLYCGLSLMALAGGAGCLRLRWWARPLMIGYGALAVLLGFVGIYFHWRIIQISRAGQPLSTFGFRFTSVAEWGVWGYGTLLGAYALWVMHQFTFGSSGISRGFSQG
jgi:hypothetical protein